MKTTSVEEAVKQLQSGAIGVMPTDTVYGLVARAADPAAVARLYEAKHREHKPGTVIAASIDQLVELGVKRRYLKAVEHLWPNPLSIVLPVGADLYYLTQDVTSLAVRIPANQAVRELLEETGPLVTSSANQPGEQPASTIAEAEAYFGENSDFYVDGGIRDPAKSSTVIRVVDDAIEVLRQGELKLDANGYPIEAVKPGCYFCRENGILQGRVIASSDKAFMVEPTGGPGNLLLIPDEHIEEISELSDEWWKEVKNLVAKSPFSLNSFNISLNYGEAAGQKVQHLHFWIVPRESDKPSSGKGLAALVKEVDEAVS